MLFGFWSRSTHTFFRSVVLKSSHDSSPVTKNWRNGFCSFRSSNWLKMRTRSALLLSESSSGTHWANFHPFPSLFSRLTMVDWSALKCSANIRVVKLSSSSTACKRASSSKSNRWSLPGSSSKLVLPDLYGLNHRRVRLSPSVPSSKGSLRSRKAYPAVWPFSKW